MAFRGHTLMAAAAVAAALSAPAGAAPDAGDDFDVFSQGLVGIAGAIGGGIGIGASVNTLYDSNILRVGDGTVLQPGVRKDDFRISPALHATFSRPVGRQRLFLSGDVGRDYFIHNKQLDRSRYGFGGGVDLAVGARCKGLLSGDFSSRQRIEATGAEVVPNVQRNLTYGFSANCASPVGFGFGGSIEHNQRRNDALSRQQFDLNSTVIAPQISYGTANLGQLSLSAVYNQVRYPNRLIPNGDGEFVSDGVNIWSGRANYSRALGTRLNFNVGLSYLKAQPVPNTVIIGLAPLTTLDRPAFSGLGYNGSLTYVSGPRLTVNASASRNASANANVGSAYQIRDALGLNVDYALRPSLSLGAGAAYTKSQYRGNFVATDARRIEDRLNRVYARVTYSPPRIYSVSFEVSHIDRKSNPDPFSFKATSAMLRLRVNFGRNAS